MVSIFQNCFKVVASLVLLTKGWSSEYLEISRFCTMLEKNYLKAQKLQVHYFQLNNFIFGFTVFQNSLLSTTDFSFRFS